MRKGRPRRCRALCAVAARRWLVGGLSVQQSIVRYRFRVAYDGTDFAGWQVQPRARTVQGCIEAALSKRFGGFRVMTLGASRTDAGVHARGQMCQADLPHAVDGAALEFQLNRMLPADIRVFDVEPAPQPTQWQAEQSLPWHAIVNAVGKRYTYRLSASKGPMDPMQRLYRARVAYAPIDLGVLESALDLFVGEHDFKAFANTALHVETSKRSTIRRVDGMTLVDEGHGDATIVVDLDGALYKMVRNIVGTAVAVARGQMALDDVGELLTGRHNRGQNPAKAAPAHGLTLQAVFYDDDDDDDLRRLSLDPILPRRLVANSE